MLLLRKDLHNQFIKLTPTSALIFLCFFDVEFMFMLALIKIKLKVNNRWNFRHLFVFGHREQLCSGAIFHNCGVFNISYNFTTLFIALVDFYWKNSWKLKIDTDNQMVFRKREELKFPLANLRFSTQLFSLIYLEISELHFAIVDFYCNFIKPKYFNSILQ